MNRTWGGGAFRAGGELGGPRAGVWGAAVWGAVLLGACGGDPSAASPPNPEGTNQPAQPGGMSMPGDTGGYDTSGIDTSLPQPFPRREPQQGAADTRVTRLSHAQYQHTVQDLFGIRDSLDLTFAPDALNGFGFDTSNDFRVDTRLGPQYRAMAESLAQRAVTDAAIFARIVPCDPATPATGGPDCAAQFLNTFGERAFRRPLSEEESQGFRQLFDLGAQLMQSGDAFRDGMQLALEAMLQSPQFLYRTDASLQQGPDGRVVLSDWEVASRLSYFLYDSMPDAELFDAARGGRLHTPEQIESEARRMLTHPRVLAKLGSFHEQAWQFGRFSRISPDRVTYPNVPSNFVSRVSESAQRFVGEVLANGGGLEELLTAPYAFIDDGLAPLYGMPAAGAGQTPGSFARVDFASGGRQGLLMQVGYLASNSYAIKTDPIHRGLFVIRNVLCRQIPDPPPGAATTPPPPTDQPIVTTRDEISLLTGQTFCPTCHSNINPPGFAFEGFDAVGQVRETENGAPVDTAAEMVLDGQRVSFSGPNELVQLLARSEEAHSCYVSRWIEFAYGRPLSTDDVGTWDTLAEESLPVADIVATLVRSPEFWSLPSSATGDDATGVAEATP